MRKKTIALTIFLVVIIALIGFVIYNEARGGKMQNIAAVKDYISVYFQGSRIIFPLNSINSTG